MYKRIFDYQKLLSIVYSLKILSLKKDLIETLMKYQIQLMIKKSNIIRMIFTEMGDLVLLKSKKIKL